MKNKKILQQIKKMGSMNQIMQRLPSVNRKILKNMNMNDKQLIWTEAIIQSMTENERLSPKIINGSRRKRIAKGSGRPIQEVNRLLKEYYQLQNLMKKVSSKSFLQMRKTAAQFMTVN